MAIPAIAAIAGKVLPMVGKMMGGSGGGGGLMNMMGGMMGGSGGPGGGIGGGQQQGQAGGGGMLGGLMTNMMPHKMMSTMMQRRDNSNIPAKKGGPMYAGGGGIMGFLEKAAPFIQMAGQMKQGQGQGQNDEDQKKKMAMAIIQQQMMQNPNAGTQRVPVGGERMLMNTPLQKPGTGSPTGGMGIPGMGSGIGYGTGSGGLGNILTGAGGGGGLGNLLSGIGGGIGMQAGGNPFFNQETMDWLMKQTGQMGNQVAQQEGANQVPPEVGSLPTKPVEQIENPAIQPVEQREPIPMPSGQPQENPMGNVMQQVAQMGQQQQPDPRTTQGTGVQDTVDNPDTLNKDAEGFTKVDSMSSGMKESADYLKQGNIFGAALAAKSHLTGMMQQGKQRRRELAQAEYLHDTAQQGSSTYADKNSVWYSAKHGAPIMPNSLHQNNNLQSVGEYQNGGDPVMERTIMGEEEGMTENAPRYVEKGKSYHYAPHAYMATIGTDKTPKTYRRTLGDMMYDIFHPKRQPRVSVMFQDGGFVNPDFLGQEGRQRESRVYGTLKDEYVRPKLPTRRVEQINNPLPTRELEPMMQRQSIKKNPIISVNKDMKKTGRWGSPDPNWRPKDKIGVKTTTIKGLGDRETTIKRTEGVDASYDKKTHKTAINPLSKLGVLNRTVDKNRHFVFGNDPSVNYKYSMDVENRTEKNIGKTNIFGTEVTKRIVDDSLPGFNEPSYEKNVTRYNPKKGTLKTKNIQHIPNAYLRKDRGKFVTKSKAKLQKGGGLLNMM